MGTTLFAKNLIRLLKFDLKSHHKAIKKYADYEFMLDNLKYEICDEIKSLRLPNVLNQKDSVAKIIKDQCSVVRYGDGEFNLMFGRAIGFQEYTPEIAARLTSGNANTSRPACSSRKVTSCRKSSRISGP